MSWWWESIFQLSLVGSESWSRSISPVDAAVESADMSIDPMDGMITWRSWTFSAPSVNSSAAPTSHYIAAVDHLLLKCGGKLSQLERRCANVPLWAANKDERCWRGQHAKYTCKKRFRPNQHQSVLDVLRQSAVLFITAWINGSSERGAPVPLLHSEVQTLRWGPVLSRVRWGAGQLQIAGTWYLHGSVKQSDAVMSHPLQGLHAIQNVAVLIKMMDLLNVCEVTETRWRACRAGAQTVWGALHGDTSVWFSVECKPETNTRGVASRKRRKVLILGGK